MSLSQQQAIRAKCVHPTGTFSEFAPEAIEQSIPDRFEHMVARHPERQAVNTGNLALTYAGLNQMANRVARAILARCGQGAEPVALLLAQGASNIAAILGVLKAGKFYVPLDPMYPPARLTYMLEDSQAHLIVTDAQHLPVAEAGGGPQQQVLNLDELQAGLADDNLGLTLGPDTLAYLLYTSGSTGAPKGVLHNHRNVLHMVKNACNGFHLCAEDRLSLLYSPSVASAARTTFSALLNGATVLPYNLREAGLAHLANWLIQEDITCYNSVATVFRHFVRTLTGAERFPSLRLIVLGSETIYKRDIELYRQHFPPTCLFVATLGATEITHIRRYFVDQEVSLPDRVVPVGYPEDGVQVLLLDESGHQVGIGAVGQIAVKSRALSLGYWRRPDLTHARFLPDPSGGDERIYLTGDLGRMHDDGCLMHVGRADFQVKIRGHRVEVGEIETALLDHPGVKEAVVMAHEDPHGEQRLAAYLVASQEATPSSGELRHSLAVKLPDYMLPTAFMFVEALPLTPSGKVDRRALPTPRQEDDAPDGPFVAPRTPLERALAELWSHVLGRTQVGIHDNFFELGGHSLIATQVVARLQATFQVEVPLRRLFERPTIAELALTIEEAKDHGTELQASTIAPISREAYGIKRSSLGETKERGHEEVCVFPASFAQQRLWFLDQLEPESPAYNIPAAYRLHGPLHVPALEQAISEIVRRHETLRTTFHAADGQPFQCVAPHRPLALPIVDLRGLPEEDNDARALQLATEEAHRPFDLAQGPLFRATLVQLAEEEHVLLLTMHHIVSDGWSKRVLNRELTALYGAFSMGNPSPLPELPIQYADFAVWQRQWLQGEVLEEQLSYWRQQLGGSPPILELPTDRPRPAVQTYRGARQSFRLPKPLSDALRALSQREGVTLFMTLLAAFQVLLHRHTDEEDLLVGSPIVGRNQVEVEGLIGFFVNTLVLRTDLSGHLTFRELLGRVREVALGAYAHQDLPFEQLVEALQPERRLSHTPLFQVFFNMLNLPDTPLALRGLASEVVSFPEAESKFDLTLYVREQIEGLHCHLVYNADLFDQLRMVELLQQFQHLLGQVVANPQAHIGGYSLVTSTAQACLPDPRIALPEPSYACVAETVLSWAERTPEQAAVCQGGQIWTYHDLAGRAQLLARILLGQGMERGEVVAVTGARSFGLIAGMTAVLASGGVLLTLDPNLPSHRQQLILREAGAKRLFYVGHCRAEDDWVRELPSVAVTWLEPDGGPMALPPELAHAKALEWPQLLPDEPAYLFFTSGTTGTPKGVLGSHKGLSHFLTWQRETFAVGPHDCCAQLTGLSFDVVLRDVFLPLSSGASLHLPEEWDDPLSEKTLSWLEGEAITLLHTVPALAQTWLMHVPDGVTLQSLRWVFFAGEPLTDALVRRWREAFPQAGRIVNLYGPTETTLAKCFYLVPSEPLPGVQPIGGPLPETQALVMRDGRQVCGIGEPGEIVIRTPFRSLGYVNAPADNRERFVPNPFREDRRDLLYHTGDRGRYRPDGSVAIHGRLDDQVKIRGVRVEPDEVTALLLQHPAVKSCAVVAHTDDQGEAFLVAYVVASEQNQSNTSGLRSYLSTQLPLAMLPSTFMVLDALPLTPNGKVDRRALPAPSGRHPALDAAYVAPRTPTEEVTTRIWADILRLEQVGVQDNFFELGGHSLLATRIISRLHGAFQVAIPLRSFLEAPTVAGLAEAIEKAKRHDSGPRDLAIVPIPREAYRIKAASPRADKGIRNIGRR